MRDVLNFPERFRQLEGKFNHLPITLRDGPPDEGSFLEAIFSVNHCTKHGHAS